MASNRIEAIVNMKGVDDGVKEMLTQAASAAEELESSSNGLQTTISALNSQWRQQQQALNAMNTQYKNYVASGQESTQAAEQLKSAIDAQKQAVQDTASAIDQASMVTKALATAEGETASRIKELNQTILEQKAKLAELQSEYDKVAQAQGKDSTAAQELKGKMDSLKSSIDSNQAELKDLCQQEIKAASSSEDLADGLNEAGDAASQSEGAFSSLSVAVGNLISQFASWGLDKLKDFGKQTLETGMNFSKSMSNVAALSGATGDELIQLSDTARYWGATTQFSASEAADALGYMALAGWNTQEMTDGLGGVLQLAAASGMELAQASDMVTDYLSAFGLQASDSAMMADMLAYAQAHSNTTAEQLGEAYKNCAASMNAAGQDIQTTTSFLEAMANQGLKGSEAGTALRAVMDSLTNSMKDGAIQIGDTSIAVQDANGNWRDLTDIVTDVEGALDGMGSAERSAAMSSAFTVEAQKALNMAFMEGMENVSGYEDALRNSKGAAEEMANAMNDNLAGDLSELSSGWEEVQLRIMEGVEPALRVIVQFISGSVIPALQNLASFIGSLPLEQLAQGITSVLSSPVGAAIGLGGAVVAGATVAKKGAGIWNKIKLLNPFKNIGQETTEATSQAASGVSGFAGIVKETFSGIGSVIESAGNAIKTVLTGIGEAFKLIGEGFAAMGVSGLIAFAGSVAVVTGAFLLLAACQDIVLPFLEGLAQIVIELANAALPALGTAIGNCAPLVEAFGVAFEGLGQGIRACLEGIASIVDSIGGAIQAVLEGIADVIRSVGDAALDTGRGMEKFANALAKIGQLDAWSLVPKLVSLGNSMQTLIDKSSGIDTVGRAFEQMGAGLKNIAECAETASNSMQHIIDIADAVKQAFSDLEGSGSQLSAIAITLSEGLDQVASVINDKWVDLAHQIEESGTNVKAAFVEMDVAIREAVSSIKEQLETVQKAIEGISQAASNLSDLDTLSQSIQTFADALKALEEIDSGTIAESLREISSASEELINYSQQLLTAGAAFEALGNGLQMIADSANQAVEGMLKIQESQEGISAAVDALEALAPRIQPIADQMRQGFIGIFNAVQEYFRPIGQTMIEVGTQIEQGFEVVTQACQNATTAFQECTTAIQDCMNIIQSATQTSMSSVEDNMTSSMNRAKQNVTQALAFMRGKFQSETALMLSVTTGNFQSIVNTIRSKMAEAQQAVSSALATMRSTLSTTIQGPTIKMPHITATTKSVGYGDGQSVTIPEFSVSYYAKGGIMDQATLFGMNGNQLMVGGEAGPEAILPLDDFYRRLPKIMAEANALERGKQKFRESAIGRYSDEYVSNLFTTKMVTSSSAPAEISFSPTININISGSASQADLQTASNGMMEQLESFKRQMFEEFMEMQMEMEDRLLA